MILSPVRDIAFQTASFCKKLGKFTDLRYCLIAGGKGFDDQFEKLSLNPDIIIGTPGRVLHHIEEGSIMTNSIVKIIIDEADKMFELNFGEQLKMILNKCNNQNRQIILISATIQNQITSFLKSGIIKEYKILSIDDENKVPEKLKIHLFYTRHNDKLYALLSLLKNVINIENELTIIFVMTKFHCDYLQEILKYWDIQSCVIYGQMEQDLRNLTLESFKKRKCKILIVTDVAARGIDIPLLDNVINYDFPDNSKLFIHRVGRTARAGRSGKCFNLITSDELPYFFDIKYILGKKISFENSLNDIDNCNYISFGSIPEKILNDIKDQKLSNIYNKSAVDIEEVEKSMIRGEKKGISFRLKPSSYGIKEAKNFLNEYITRIHPYFLKNIDEEKNNFINQLRNYKPKQNYFESVRKTNVDLEVLNDFKKKVEVFKEKKLNEKKLDQLKKEQEEINHIKEDAINEFKNKIVEDNNTLIKESKYLGKKIKRSKMLSFKNQDQYISSEKNDKINLWGNEKPLNLEELTLNINCDDTMEKKQKEVWNKKKGTFEKVKYDSFGNIIKNGSNSQQKKDFHPFKKWKKKNKIVFQKIGEIENENKIRKNKELIQEKKEEKQIKSETKTLEQLLKTKKQQFKEKQKKYKKFSKKKYKENLIKQRVNLNSKSQTFIKKRKK